MVVTRNIFLSLFKYFILMCQVALLYTMPDQDTVMKLKCVSMGRVSESSRKYFSELHQVFFFPHRAGGEAAGAGGRHRGAGSRGSGLQRRVSASNHHEGANIFIEF